MRRGILSLFIVSFLLFSGCAGKTVTSSQQVEATGIPECVGEIVQPPAGLFPVEDEALLNAAHGDKGEGKLCKGKVYQVAGKVIVYRVWDKAKDYSLYGGWWSFDVPKGPRDAYRKANDICPSWSPLNVMSSCTVKPGTKLVVGPGQSAKCDKAGYTIPQSPVNQVYIPNNSRENILFVEDCTPGTSWP